MQHTSFGSHTDAIRYTNGAELVANDPRLYEGPFDPLTQTKNVPIARVALVPVVSRDMHEVLTKHWPRRPWLYSNLRLH